MKADQAGEKFDEIDGLGRGPGGSGEFAEAVQASGAERKRGLLAAGLDRLGFG